MDEQSSKLFSLMCDYAITEIGENVFLKEGSELEEGEVYLLYGVEIESDSCNHIKTVLKLP